MIHRILAQPLYRHAPVSTLAAPARSLPQIAWDWFVRHVLGPLFPPLARALDAAHGAGTIVGIVLVAAALAGVAYVVVRLVLAFARRSPSAPGPAPAAGLPPTPLSAAQWRARAREAAARGDYARAIAALWAAALALLDERALVALDAARTPGEYRRLVRRFRAPACAPFDALSERFVYAAYAGQPPSASDFEAAQAALVEFESAEAAFAAAPAPR